MKLHRSRRATIEPLEGRTLLTAVPTVSLPATSALAGSTMVFTVTLSAATTGPVTGAYGVGDGTADLNDYDTEASGTFTIPAGSTHTEIDVRTFGDQATPDSEYFVLVLSNLSSNATFANGGSTEQNGGTIVSTVGATAAVTTLTAPSLTANTGSAVTLTADVAGAATGEATPTGVVYFLDNGNAIGATQTLDSTGKATLITPALTAGTHTFTASYNGDPTYKISASNPVTVRAGAATSTTSTVTLTSDTALPTFGQSVTFTATVAPAVAGGVTPAGVVDFYAGGSLLQGSVTLVNGAATFTTSSLPSGTVNLTAYYIGTDAAGSGANYLSSTSAVLSQTVGSIATTTTALSIVPGTTYSGTTVQIIATVAPSFASDFSPTGTVSFYNAGVLFDTEAVDGNGHASSFSSTLPVGANAIIAVYGGDSLFGASTAAAATVTILQASTLLPTISHAVAPKSTIIGQKYSASVPVEITSLGLPPTGSLTVNLLVNGSAEFDQNAQPVGTLTKTYPAHASRIGLTFHLKSLPSTLTTGQYFFVVQVIDSTGASNAGALATPFIAAAPTFQLNASAGAISPATITVKKAGTLAVTLLNTGNVDLTSALSVTLSPSTDGVTPLSITLATAVVKKIKSGKKAVAHLHFKAPVGLTAGTYFVIASVTSTQVTATAVSTTAFTFAG